MIAFSTLYWDTWSHEWGWGKRGGRRRPEVSAACNVWYVLYPLHSLTFPAFIRSKWSPVIRRIACVFMREQSVKRSFISTMLKEGMRRESCSGTGIRCWMAELPGSNFTRLFHNLIGLHFSYMSVFVFCHITLATLSFMLAMMHFCYFSCSNKSITLIILCTMWTCQQQDIHQPFATYVSGLESGSLLHSLCLRVSLCTSAFITLVDVRCND